MLKPVWTYAMQLWGTSSNSNIEILQRYQNKVLRSIVNATWYVTNYATHQYLKIPFVREEIVRLTEKYLQRLRSHENELATNLLDNNETLRTLKRCHILDILSRF